MLYLWWASWGIVGLTGLAMAYILLADLWRYYAERYYRAKNERKGLPVDC